LLEGHLSDPDGSGRDWDCALANHLHALRTRPPHQVIDDLAADLYALHTDIAQSRHQDATRWLYRVAAILACVQANALTRIGDHEAAIRWWSTARRTADASGDLEVRLLVRGEEAIHGLYGQREPRRVLALVAAARRITDRPWPRLVAAEAKALAMLGRHSDATRTLDRLVDAAERVGGDSLGWWKVDQVYFARSWVHAAAGSERAADAARDRVLSTVSRNSYQYRINVRLHEAICTVVQGGIDAGCRHAAELIDATPAAYRTNHVVETGRRVLGAVPPGRQASPAVADLRTVLVAASGGGGSGHRGPAGAHRRSG